MARRVLKLRRISAVDSNGQTIWIADAHRGGGKRRVARGGEKSTAFLELEAAIREIAVRPWCP